MESYTNYSEDADYGNASHVCNDSQYNIDIIEDLSNYTWDELKEWGLFYSPLEQLHFGIIMPVILVFGVIGNLLFTVSTFRVKAMHTATNYYLINLGLADTMFLIISVGGLNVSLLLTTVDGDINHFGEILSKIRYFLLTMSSFASLFFVTTVTYDKYRAICHPLQHRARSSWRIRARCITFIVWVISCSMVTATFPLMDYITICIIYPPGNHHNHPNVVSFFYIDSVWKGIVFNLIPTVPFFLGLFPCLYMYVGIIRQLHKRIRIPSYTPHFVSNCQRLRNSVAKMLVLNGSVFFLCNLPFHTLCLAYVGYQFLDDVTKLALSPILTAITPYARMLMYVNSAVNPYIYSTVNKSYRTAFIRALSCRKVRKKFSTKRRRISFPQPTAETDV